MDDDDGDDGTIMGSERWTFTLGVDLQDVEGGIGDINDHEFVKDNTIGRLIEYSMPEDLIERMAVEAFDFAKEKAVDPQNASLFVIPVAVGLNVCTVQQEGEPIEDAVDRAAVTIVGPDKDLWCYLKNLPKIRVEDVDGVCPICLDTPMTGSKMSLLPLCRHAFHFECVVAWLVKSKSCPLCRQQAHDFPVHEVCERLLK
ncbi:hypothetical protein DH2020_019930 [Rehmannia glutinosa]|uniref:RING-type domain-containing protein n=1 Tax=Rehmannia glutinosa TaxID=99300 RepID=A0ABR0WEN7_REHGL